MISKNTNKQRKVSGKAILAAGMLAAASILPAHSEEILKDKRPSLESSDVILFGRDHKQRHDLMIYFDPQISKTDQIEINSIYGSESDSQGIPDYINSYVSFSGNNLYVGPGLPVTPLEIFQTQAILRDIKNGNINSPSDLIASSQNSSKLQKIILGSAFAGTAYSQGYDKSLGRGEVLSQEDFFKKLQIMWQNPQYDNPDYLIGICTHIASDAATLENSLGVRTAVATGVSGRIGHAYDVSLLDGETAVWDGGNVIVAPTQNIKKALELYQFLSNSATFQHQFFEDSKFKYSFITKDGENYLCFVGYDPSTDTIKKALFNILPEVMPLSVNLTEKTYLSEKKLSSYGMFVSTGETRGDSMSALEKISLTQAGYSGNFASAKLPGFSIRPSFSLVFGDMQYKKNKDDPSSKDVLFGLSGDTIISYNQKEGFNMSFRVGYSGAFNVMSTYFYDVPLEAGVSYKFSTKNLGNLGKIGIEPYLISQFGILPYDLGTLASAPQLTEAKTGVALTVPLAKDSSVSLDPYFSLKNSSIGGGLDAKLTTRFTEFSLGLDASQHTYDFTPNTLGINAGISVSLSDRSKVSVTYDSKFENYGGEIDNSSSVTIGGTVKY